VSKHRKYTKPWYAFLITINAFWHISTIGLVEMYKKILMMMMMMMIVM